MLFIQRTIKEHLNWVKNGGFSQKINEDKGKDLKNAQQN